MLFGGLSIKAKPMGRRGYKRLQIALPVTISGLDTNGNPFKQTATTVEIGPKGMRLRGVHCLRGRGDPVRVDYKNVRADFRVAWMGDIEGLVGLEGLEDAQFLFAKHLPPDTKMVPDPRADTYVVPGEDAPISMAPAAKPIPMETRPPERRLQERRQQERRRHPRYHCAGSVKIFEQGIPQPTTRRMNEISTGGCYIEMMSPLPASSPVGLEIKLNGRTIRVDGQVKSSQLAYGMGVAFTAMAPPEKEKLTDVIAEVSGEKTPSFTEPEPAAAAPPKVEQVPAKLVGEAVQRWFGTHDALSRADFLKLVEELRLLAK
jgi:hypothetical protein